jgi:hypothetical protein
MVVAALAMTALLAFAALVLNFGLFLVERRKLQTAADAAAMAATWKIMEQQGQRCFSDAPITAAANAMAQRNGVDLGSNVVQVTYVNQAGSTVAGSVSDQVAGARVRISGQVSTVLPGFSGHGLLAINAQGEAAMKRTDFSAVFDDPAPLAVPRWAFDSIRSYDIYSITNPIRLLFIWLGSNGYPILDLAHPGNQLGADSVNATDYGYGAAQNYRFWADGAHDSGRFGAGDRIAVIPAGSQPQIRDDVEDGLSDRVIRGGLSCGASTYVVFPLFVYDNIIEGTPPLVPHRIVVAGITMFRALAANIDQDDRYIFGHFVPSVYDPANQARVSGPLWGPSVAALTR